jgi:hypothetical protein
MKTDRNAEINSNFVPPTERSVQPGVAHIHPEGQPVEDLTENVVRLPGPGRIVVGRVDTTRQTLK